MRFSSTVAYALPLLIAAAQAQSPGQSCTGNVAYCVVGSPIILRCNGNTLNPGNCDDNLNEPPLGALCVESNPNAGDAVCSAVGSPSPSPPVVSGGTSLPPQVPPGPTVTDACPLGKLRRRDDCVPANRTNATTTSASQLPAYTGGAMNTYNRADTKGAMIGSVVALLTLGGALIL